MDGGALAAAMNGPGRIVMVAGEPSGDRHGALLARALKATPGLAGLALEGIAGPAMRAAGVRPLARMEDVAVVGFAEVLGHLPALLAARRAIDAALAAPGARLFLPIDFPGFNLPLAKRARRHGVPVLQYVAPQVWAWGRGRLAALRRDVDRLAVILPFEEAWFREHGVAATFVGHPLLDGLEPERDRARFARETDLDAAAPWLALLPGSRDQEVARHAGPLLGAFAALRRERPEARAIVAAASPAHRARLEAAVPAGERPYVRVVEDGTREALAFARAALVASGTATLECGALGTPLVVLYRMATVSHAIARRVVKLQRFGLVNIVAGEDVAPELLQAEVTPERILAALLPLWDDGAPRAAAQARLGRVRGLLGTPGASARVAALAAALVTERA
jgi:lipid-A-disaccharide synthase